MVLVLLLEVVQLLDNKMYRAAIRDFRNEVSKSRRHLLLDKAHELGGSDLVNKWIGLHVVGEKQEQIKKIAQEAGYI